MLERAWEPWLRHRIGPMKPRPSAHAALTVLDFKDRTRSTAESLREQATLLSNLGEFRRAAGRPGAEESLRRSITICDELLARKPVRRADRQTLAIAQNNLAEVLVVKGQDDEANRLFTRSIAGLDALASEMPKAADTRNYLGYVHEQLGKLLVKAGQPEKARESLKQAVAHQRQAVALTDGKVRAYQIMLVGHLAALAEVSLGLRDYDSTVASVIEMPKAAPGSGNACLDAARILADCLVPGRRRFQAGHAKARGAEPEVSGPDRRPASRGSRHQSQAGRQGESRTWFFGRSSPDRNSRPCSAVSWGLTPNFPGRIHSCLEAPVSRHDDGERHQRQ